MFIEDYFKGDAISTELYDVYAIKSIIKGYYELYDNILSKIAILLGVDKNYFVKINFRIDNCRRMFK